MQIVLFVGLMFALMPFAGALPKFHLERITPDTVCSMRNRASTDLTEMKAILLSDLMHYRLLKDAACPDVTVAYALVDGAKGSGVQDFENDLLEAGRIPGLKIYCVTVMGRLAGGDNGVFYIYEVRRFKRVTLHKNQRFELSKVNCEK